jgi:hypothetical protein
MPFPTTISRPEEVPKEFVMNNTSVKILMGAAMAALSLQAGAASQGGNDLSETSVQGTPTSLAGSVRQGKGLPVVKGKAQSSQSRADVKEATLYAIEAGNMYRPGERGAPPADVTASTTSRAQVRADTRAAAQRGELLHAGEITRATR